MMWGELKFALVLFVLVATLATGCGATGVATPREQPGVFITRILREEINGQWARQWSELHPGHQQLIGRDAYVRCSRNMATNIGNGREVFRVLDVQNAPIHVEGVPQRTSKLVTISFRRPGSTPALTYRLHAVNVDGHWAWILGSRFLAEVAHGRCLDGTQLTPTA